MEETKKDKQRHWFFVGYFRPLYLLFLLRTERENNFVFVCVLFFTLRLWLYWSGGNECAWDGKDPVFESDEIARFKKKIVGLLLLANVLSA